MKFKNIPSFENYTVDESGTIKNRNTGRVRKISINNGYAQVVICKEGKMTTKKVHRLVAEAFIPNPENKPCVNHINNIRHDNRLENLEWCTKTENTQHSMEQGRMRYPGDKGEHKGCGNPRAKLTGVEVLNIRQLLVEGKTQKQIAVLFKVSQGTVSKIKLGKRWLHLQTIF